MVQNNMYMAVSLYDAVFDKWLGIKMEHLGSHVSGSAYPPECSDQQDQIPAGATEEGGKHDHRHQLWQKHENVDNTIQRSANNALSSCQRANYASQNQH